MLLTLTTTHRPATDLGYLLVKHPARFHSFSLAWGQAHVFFPEAEDERCTAALAVDIDAIGLVRGGTHSDDSPLARYVNDRPYAASSFLSVAIGRVFREGLAGRCKELPELAAQAIPLEATVHALPCRGGEPLLRSLFEPLGYEVDTDRLPLDASFPDWGDSRFFDVRLRATTRLSDLLQHLYVLVPVLDDTKHYWVGSEEVDKLLARGADWLTAHPERELIADRYLKHQRHLVRGALERLREADDLPAEGEDEVEEQAAEDTLERPLSLAEQRDQAVLGELRAAGARSVGDLGCGEGRLLRLLAKHFERVVGVEVCLGSLQRAEQRFDPNRTSARVLSRVTLLHGSVTYRDARLSDLDAAVLVEVVEHVEPSRLPALEAAVFASAGPATVIVTTPNVEYNALFANLPAGTLRHRDHRFEWTRAEFAAWAEGVAERHDYTVRFEPIGSVDPILGAPTQMAVFKR